MNRYDPRQQMLPPLPVHYGEQGMPVYYNQTEPPPPPREFLNPTDKEVKDALRMQGLIPRKSSGTRASASPSQDVALADITFDYAKNLIAYANVDNPDLAPAAVGNPLNVAPVGANPPVGGCIALAELRFGCEGSNQTVMYDLPPGAIVKTPFAAQTGKLILRLAPKYLTNNDGGIVANKRVYLIQPGGPQLNNQQFNLLPPAFLAMQGFTVPGVTSNLAPGQGWFAEGSVTVDSFSKPTRRFYGSVRTGAAAQFQNTLVPVAWAAVAVQVTGGLSPTPAGGLAVTLQFSQNGPAGSVAVGPYPMNQIVPLIDNCQSLEIFNSNAVPAGQEAPFEVCYYLSF